VTRRHRWQFVRWTVAWLLGSAVLLSTLGLLSVETIVVAGTTGLLVVAEATEPSRLSPRWRGRIRWFVVLGFVGVALAIGRRFLELLPPEVLPWG
jgi:hypothetical protein